jgi:hypothetical protein
MLLTAKKNPYVSEKVDLFETLVRAGEEKSSIILPFNLRAFLVNCLVEHLCDPDIAHIVLALDLLEPTRKVGNEKAVFLKRRGDASLLLAGLFPERARRLHVSSSYFRFMGQAFYSSLSAHLSIGPAIERGMFYNEVAREFGSLAYVLKSARAPEKDDWRSYLRFRAAIM